MGGTYASVTILKEEGVVCVQMFIGWVLLVVIIIYSFAKAVEDSYEYEGLVRFFAFVFQFIGGIIFLYLILVIIGVVLYALFWLGSLLCGMGLWCLGTIFYPLLALF